MAFRIPAKQPTPPHLSQTVVSPTSANSTDFQPRKEFLKDQRIASSFSLLAFSSSSLVRLYSFPHPVNVALRKLFDQHNLIAGSRENTPQNFVEFTIDGKPWSNPKSIKSEKLIIDILSVIFAYGYTYLSTIDYGREQDDRLAIAFSRPSILPPPSSPPNSSATSLHHVVRTPFAISYSSITTMRVIGAPLPSTPAILQAVRGAWPRGVVSEKKVGDATYEFKLKGYKWFQEDTFATDSLQHILGLLGALDGHGFTLLASLTLTNRSRVKDLWVFTGVPNSSHGEGTPASSPNNSTLELRREMTPQSFSPQSTLTQSPLTQMSSNGRRLPMIPSTMGPRASIHSRSISETMPVNSSPLKTQPFKATTLLRKPSPKQKIPAVQEVIEGHTVSADKSPSVGSIDMTGIGSGIRKSMDMPRTPDAQYATDGRPNASPSLEYDPYQNVGSPSPPAPMGPRDRRTSSDAKRGSLFPLQISDAPRVGEGAFENRAASRPPSVQPSSTPFAPSLQIQVHAASPVATQGQGFSGHGISRSNSNRYSPKDTPTNETPRIPTPPLLSPGVFRDSAFSSSTDGRQSYEIPVAWTGRDPEILPNNGRGSYSDRKRSSSSGTEDRHNHSQSGSAPPTRPDYDRNSTGPLPPGAWSAPRQDKRDTSHSHSRSYSLPSPIEEKPSLEQAELAAGFSNHPLSLASDPTLSVSDQPQGTVRSMSPEHVYPDSTRKSEAAVIGILPKATPATTTTSTHNLKVKRDKGKAPPIAVRKETSASTAGWVMVNVEGAGKGASSGKSGSRSPNRGSGGSRPKARTRSSSDSRIPSSSSSARDRSPKPQEPPAQSSMSAAAKAIVIIDAVGAKEEEKNNSAVAGFKRMFNRARGVPDSVSPSPEPSRPPTTRRRTPPDGGITKTKPLEVEEREESLGRGRLRGTPPTSRSRKRMSVN